MQHGPDNRLGMIQQNMLHLGRVVDVKEHELTPTFWKTVEQPFNPGRLSRYKTNTPPPPTIP